ncbi:MAG: acyl-CoA thioester hydrolase/BAAT C-terminal domain-containing protein [Pseudomonadota bacterium]
MAACGALLFAASPSLAQAPPLEVLEPGETGERITEGGLLGNYYPAGSNDAPAPAILLVGGSEGGLGQDMTGLSRALQSEGYSVLHLSWWRAEGQPKKIEAIPIEYFVGALDWLRAREGVAKDKIAMFGWSRGSEAALLTAMRYPALNAVLVSMPANAVFPGFWWDGPPMGLGGPFTWRSKEIPNLGLNWMAMMGKPKEDYAKALISLQEENPDAVIAIESIEAPVLILCGEEDQLWPSCPMARRAKARADAAGKRDVELLALKDAGHWAVGAPLAPDTPAYARLEMFNVGGSMEGTVEARQVSFDRIVAFLEANLNGR